jgi:hypothetical protein
MVAWEVPISVLSEAASGIVSGVRSYENCCL